MREGVVNHLLVHKLTVHHYIRIRNFFTEFVPAYLAIHYNQLEKLIESIK